MSVDFNSTPMNNAGLGESETPMFSGVPSWERNRKRGMFGGKPKSRAAATVQVGEPVVGAAPLSTTSVDENFAAAPSYATRPVKKGRTGLPMAVAAGIVAIGGLAAAGWYATQPHEAGVAQLTPGTESTALPASDNALATNTAATPSEALPAQAAPTPAKAATPPARASTRVAAAAPARTRPAAVSRSATDAGVNTSATLPAAPQPYSGTATAPAAPADVAPTAPAPKWNIPPAATTAPPTPAEAAPSVTPPAAATPPVQTPPN